jgi:ABC-type transporter Mla subunit MlaD
LSSSLDQLRALERIASLRDLTDRLTEFLRSAHRSAVSAEELATSNPPLVRRHDWSSTLDDLDGATDAIRAAGHLLADTFRELETYPLERALCAASDLFANLSSLEEEMEQRLLGRSSDG